MMNVLGDNTAPESLKIARKDILRRDLWIDRQQHGSDASHISFMRSICQPIRQERSEEPVKENLFVLYVSNATAKNLPFELKHAL